MSTFRPWRIVHIDLAVPLEPLNRADSFEATALFLWYRDQPLGELRLHTDELPLSRAQLAERIARAVTPAVGSRALGRGFPPRPPPATSALDVAPTIALDPSILATLEIDLGRGAEANDAPSGGLGRPKLSVIVCTRDRPAALEICLDSLARCHEPAEEVVVVDNAPASTGTRDVVQRFPNVSYLAEPRPGLSVARNTGLRAVRGEVIAFTDDDVTVHPAWASRVRDALAADRFTAMTGLVLPSNLDTASQVYFESVFGGFSQGYYRKEFDAAFFAEMKRKAVPVWSLGAGANMAFRREAFAAAGGFDERLGAGAAGCSEDSELWYRLLASGRRCVYDPLAVAFHCHRGDIETLRSQMRLYMRGHVAALFVQFEKHRHWGNLRRIAVSLPASYLWRVLALPFQAEGLRRPVLASEIAGVLAGFAWHLRHRRDPGAPSLPSY